MKTISLSIVLGLVIAGAASATDCCAQPACCDEPGCCAAGCDCGPACQVVCEMKKVEKAVWVVECEEFCAPLPCLPLPCCGTSSRGCCDDGCCGDDCGCGCDPCASLQKPMVPPICGKVRCRKKLVKKTITCEVPVYKCVVCGAASCCDAVAECDP